MVRSREGVQEGLRAREGLPSSMVGKERRLEFARSEMLSCARVHAPAKGVFRCVPTTRCRQSLYIEADIQRLN